MSVQVLSLIAATFFPATIVVLIQRAAFKRQSKKQSEEFALKLAEESSRTVKAASQGASLATELQNANERAVQAETREGSLLIQLQSANERGDQAEDREDNLKKEISRVEADLTSQSARAQDAEKIAAAARAESEQLSKTLLSTQERFTGLTERFGEVSVKLGQFTERSRLLEQEVIHHKPRHVYYKVMCEGLLPIVEGLLVDLIRFDTLLTEAEQREQALQMQIGLRQIRDALKTAAGRTAGDHF